MLIGCLSNGNGRVETWISLRNIFILAWKLHCLCVWNYETFPGCRSLSVPFSPAMKLIPMWPSSRFQPSVAYRTHHFFLPSFPLPSYSPFLNEVEDIFILVHLFSMAFFFLLVLSNLSFANLLSLIFCKYSLFRRFVI